MFKKSVFVVSFLLCFTLVFALPPENPNQQPLDETRTVDNTTLINSNLITMFVTNHGNFGRDLSGYFGYDYGTWFPVTDTSDIRNNTNNTAYHSPLYAAGIWLGGKVNGQTRVTVSEYSSEYRPGPMVDGTYQPDDPSFHVYKIFEGGEWTNDYATWPWYQGAPVDEEGHPKLLGTQTLWSVFNDAYPYQHTNMGTPPLGVEVQQTVFGFTQDYVDTTWSPSQTLLVTQDGSSTAIVTADLIDPNAVTGHDYTVNIGNDETLGSVWNLYDETLGIFKLENQTNFSGDNNYEVVDGYQVKVISQQGSFLGFSSFEVVANANGPVDPPEAAAAHWQGFPTPTGVDPDGYPTDGQQVGAGKWLFHTADNGGTNDGGTRASYEAFLTRSLRNDDPDKVGKYDFEMRFTEEGSYAVAAYAYPETIVWVPFELWRIGINTPNDPSDDVRMTPWILEWDEDNIYQLDNWGDSYNGSGGFEHSVSDGNDDPYTDWIYWILPTDDSPGESGYLADVATFDLINMTPGSYAYDGEEYIARTVLVNWNGGSQPPFNQDLPEQGTVFRILTQKTIPEDTFHFTQTIEQVINSSPEGNTVYIKYKLYNKSWSNNIEDMYISLWVDPDLGGAGDDFVGCDTISNIFYCYNDPGSVDNSYGANPPVIGFKFLKGPIVAGIYSDTADFDGTLIPGYKNLNMTSFNKYINGTDPDDEYQAYNYMRGLTRDGGNYIYNGQVLRYLVSGDPVTGQGDIDVSSADRRMMASCGPINMNPGDSQYVFLKMAVAYGENGVHPINKVKEILNSPIPDYPPAPPVLKTEITPDPQFEFMKRTINPITGIAYVGYDSEGSIGKPIDYASLTINTDVPIDSFISTSGISGFTGPTALLYFPVKEFLTPYGTLTDITEADYTISGQYFDGSPLSCTGQVTLIGHMSGDFNLDGTLDIGDLVAWVEYAFNNGTPPQYEEILDMDYNGEVDITDLILFVQYMFPQ